MKTRFTKLAVGLALATSLSTVTAIAQDAPPLVKQLNNGNWLEDADSGPATRLAHPFGN